MGLEPPWFLAGCLTYFIRLCVVKYFSNVAQCLIPVMAHCINTVYQEDALLLLVGFIFYKIAISSNVAL